MNKLLFIIMIIITLVVIIASASFKVDAKSKEDGKHITPQGVPLPGDYTITAYYHDLNYYNIFHEWHTGIDMVPSLDWSNSHTNQPILLHTTISGTAYRYNEKCTGNAALVINDDYIIYLGHVEKFLYTDNTPVHFGDTVAVMGQSGELGKCVTGPHVHYEIFKKINSTFTIIDPISYL